MDNEKKQRITSILMKGCNPTYKTLEGMVEEIASVVEKRKTIIHTLYSSSDQPNTLKYELHFDEILRKIDKAEREGYMVTQIELWFKVDADAHLYGLPVRYKILD